MGCGASSAPKAKYGSDESGQKETTPSPPVATNPPPDTVKAEPLAKAEPPTTTPTEKDVRKAPVPILTKSGSMLSSSKASSSGRRPSVDIAAVEGHENHVMKRENDESAPMQRLSITKVQTEMELWWMSAIPELFGVADSDELDESFQEDSQADYCKKIVGVPRGEVTSILTDWLKDCPTEARQVFIDKVLKELGQIDETKKPVKTVTLNVTPGAEKRGKLLRKGTGFVTSGQVRQLACQDWVDQNSSDSSDDDEKDDEAFEMAMEKSRTETRTRLAVSSEKHQVDADWQPPVFPKSPEQHQRIADAVSESFMFAALGFDQLEQVINAFEEVNVEPGTKVIEQNAEVGATDRGLYVLERGELEVFKIGSDSPVFTYTEMGQYFGDLALLYNAPRSATVISKTPCTLWSIDRTTFNCLVKDAAQKAKERRYEFLTSVEILKDLETDEVAKINDALRERTFGTGVHIITEGENGEEFFILEKGSAAAIKEGKRLKEYVSSDYFGELALLKHEPRAADVITLSDCTVLSLKRDAFHRLLGPLDTILQERAKNYDANRIV